MKLTNEFEYKLAVERVQIMTQKELFNTCKELSNLNTQYSVNLLKVIIPKLTVATTSIILKYYNNNYGKQQYIKTIEFLGIQLIPSSKIVNLAFKNNIRVLPFIVTIMDSSTRSIVWGKDTLNTKVNKFNLIVYKELLYILKATSIDVYKTTKLPPQKELIKLLSCIINNSKEK